MADEDQTRTVLFCTQCFATDQDGSWGGTMLGNHPNTFCTNCCGQGTFVQMPKFAADSIRRQASWVGKRYYPSDEDQEITDELKRLRRRAGKFHLRTARESSQPGMWTVEQQTPNGHKIGMFFDASSAEQALEMSREHLPFYSAEDFN